MRPLDEVVLVSGPDVMFETLDLNPHDDSIEVIAAHFFGRKLSIHSIRGMPEYPYVQVADSSEIGTIGRPYGLCLVTFRSDGSDDGAEDTTLDAPRSSREKSGKGGRYKTQKARPKNLDHSSCDPQTATHILVTTHECSYDVASAFDMAIHTLRGDYPKVKTRATREKIAYGQSIRTTPSPSAYDYTGQRADASASELPNTMNGGSLFAYAIPRAKGVTLDSWKRSTLFKGFKVRGWGGIFSPGAPGFPYVFRMPHKPQVRVYPYSLPAYMTRYLHRLCSPLRSSS
jgi:hypothetical protein